MQYTAIFNGCKNVHFRMDFFLNIFLIFAQNIDCGYTLEPPQSGGSNEYPQSMLWSKNKKKVYPCKPQLYYIKVGCKGVFVTRTCFRDDNTMVLSMTVARLLHKYACSLVKYRQNVA